MWTKKIDESRIQKSVQCPKVSRGKVSKSRSARSRNKGKCPLSWCVPRGCVPGILRDIDTHASRSKVSRHVSDLWSRIYGSVFQNYWRTSDVRFNLLRFLFAVFAAEFLCWFKLQNLSQLEMADFMHGVWYQSCRCIYFWNQPRYFRRNFFVDFNFDAVGNGRFWAGRSAGLSVQSRFVASAQKK